MAAPQPPAPPKTRPAYNGEPVLWGMIPEGAEHLQGIDDYVELKYLCLGDILK